MPFYFSPEEREERYRKPEKFTRVEDMINVFDNTRYWMYIPGFNGYEVSNDGIIRSMKHYVKYPCGILIKPVNRKPYKDSCDPLYELSDDNNKRQRIRLSSIMHLALESQYTAPGYPRSTIMTYENGRNKWVQDDNGAWNKVYNGPGVVKKSPNIPPMDNKAKYFKFTVIQQGNELPGMTYRIPQYEVPIESIEGDEYYGRKDARTICGSNVCPGSERILNRCEPQEGDTLSPRWPEDGPTTNHVWGFLKGVDNSQQER